MAKKKTKTKTKAEIRRLLLAPVDLEKENWSDALHEVVEVCRWFEKAARLYGRRCVVGAMRTWARGDYFDEVSVDAWLDYLRRWRARQDVHVIPYTVASDTWFVADNMMHLLVFAPRAEQAEGLPTAVMRAWAEKAEAKAA